MHGLSGAWSTKSSLIYIYIDFSHIYNLIDN